MFRKLSERLLQSESGLIALVNLLAAMIQAGRDTSQLEAAVAAALGEGQEQKPAAENAQVVQQAHAQVAQAQPAQNRTNSQGQAAGDGTATGTFHVLEARESKPGVVRVYAEAENGEKFPIFAKNGNAQTLAAAIGKAVQVRYRKGEKGLIALSVRLAG